MGRFSQTADGPIELWPVARLEAEAKKAEADAATARASGSALLAEGYESFAAKCRSRAKR